MSDKDPSQIRKEIEETTGGLSDSVEAIASEKGHLKEDAVEEVKHKVAKASSQKKQDVVEATKDKLTDTKDAVASKVRQIIRGRHDGSGQA